jgi:hypothetical protein
MVKPGVRVLLWGVTAAAVTVVASFAIAASVVAGGNVLSRDDVARALTPTPTPTRTPGTATGANPTSTAPTPAGSTTTAPTGGAAGSGATDRIVSGTSGSVTVRCNGAMATLLSWSPNPGYRADDPVRGPAATVSVKFESQVAEDMIVTATCSGGQATVTETAEADDHSGRGGGDD